MGTFFTVEHFIPPFTPSIPTFERGMTTDFDTLVSVASVVVSRCHAARTAVVYDLPYVCGLY
jgi:hypothetical protein